MRKLVTVQKIDEISSIENADKIEVARIHGWRVVVGKDEFKVGEKIAFFEIDSFLSEENPVYEAFQPRGQKTMEINGKDVKGHALKTIKLRGVFSQGLIMSLDKLTIPDTLEVGSDITEASGVLKWEEPIPLGGNIIGPFDTRFAPKTDAERLQNLVEFWEVIKEQEWEPTVKVDGTSQTLINDSDKISFFGRNWKIDPSESAGFQLAEKLGLVKALEDMGHSAVIQGELVGTGIQSNRLRLEGKRFIVFSVWFDSNKLPRSEWPEAALENATPILGEEYLPKNFETPEELIEFVNGLNSKITKNVKDEGVVFHPKHPSDIPFELGNNLDRNLNFKVISNSWLIKNKI